MQNQFIKGEPVEILKTVPCTGSDRGKKRAVVVAGTIHQVCNGFAVVDFGYYKESFYFEQIRKSKTEKHLNKGA